MHSYLEASSCVVTVVVADVVAVVDTVDVRVVLPDVVAVVLIEVVIVLEAVVVSEEVTVEEAEVTTVEVTVDDAVVEAVVVAVVNPQDLFSLLPGFKELSPITFSTRKFKRVAVSPQLSNDAT